jgi:hypothetical protein
MKIKINKIKITGRIRKEINKIEELAEDIRENGLITPIAVFPLDNGKYQLLAGLRRVRAMELNGETEIDAKVFPISDADSSIAIEYSENEQREPLTFSEKMDYAKLIEEVEMEKAKERQSMGGKGRVSNNETGAIRDKIGAKIGMSGRQYARAKYIVENAPQKIIDELDNNERTVTGTYNELCAKEKYKNKFRHNEQFESPTPILTPPPRTKEVEFIPIYNKSDYISPEAEIKELQNQIKKERIRAAIAESKLVRETELRKNEAKHYNTIIEMLKKQLNRTYIKISELETKYEPGEKTSWKTPETEYML